MLPAILGLSGPDLTADERAFFRAAQPAGYILFSRNCRDRRQLRALTDSLREVSGRPNLPVLIDQEGGRVARLAPPQWPEFPAAGRFARLYRRAPISGIEAARANGEALAVILSEAGINVNCAPVLDLRHEGAHHIVGDRAFGDEPLQVAALGRAMLDGMEAGGVCGVVKHMPGHGRARTDSHVELPVAEVSEAELEIDLAPFRALKNSPMAMVAHLLYPAWDPERPASISPEVIGRVIRGRIGFDGLLISDDLAMAALAGSAADRAAAAIGAGCDLVLHCSGELSDNRQIADALGTISDAARQRLERAMARIYNKVSPHGYDQLVAKRDSLLAYA